MLHRVLIACVLAILLFACEKKVATIPEVAPQPSVPAEEPIHAMAREVAGKISAAMHDRGISSVHVEKLDSHEIISPAAFSYFENALIAQLAAAGIQRKSGGWSLQGDLSKQQDQLVFSFELYKNGEPIHSDSAHIPYDQRLKNTLAQFEPSSAEHDHHAMHPEMPVPTPLAQLKQAPLDVAENCTDQGDCKLLLLYSNELVERNWKDGSERVIRLPRTALRSRAPSGKILPTQSTFFVISNNLIAPVALHRNLEQARADYPSHLPLPEPTVNTYVLADGRFFDFELFGAGGLAVIDTKNRLSVAEQGKLISADHPVGGTLRVSLPYIYTSAPSVDGRNQDSILKFLYKDGRIDLERSQNMDGSIYDIAITDLNRDQKREMLVTVRNARGIFIEVHEPF